MTPGKKYGRKTKRALPVDLLFKAGAQPGVGNGSNAPPNPESSTKNFQNNQAFDV